MDIKNNDFIIILGLRLYQKQLGSAKQYQYFLSYIRRLQIFILYEKIKDPNSDINMLHLNFLSLFDKIFQWANLVLV